MGFHQIQTRAYTKIFCGKNILKLIYDNINKIS